MLQGLEVHTALADNANSVPSTQVGQLTVTYNTSYRDTLPFLGSHKHCTHTHKCTHIHMPYKLII